MSQERKITGKLHKLPDHCIDLWLTVYHAVRDTCNLCDPLRNLYPRIHHTVKALNKLTIFHFPGTDLQYTIRFWRQSGGLQIYHYIFIHPYVSCLIFYLYSFCMVI